MSVGVFDLRDHGRIPAPSGDLRSAPHASSPSGSHRIGCDHLIPHRIAGSRVHLIGATGLTRPIGGELVVGLRGHRGAVGRQLRGRIGRARTIVGGSEQHQLADLFRMPRGVAGGARPAQRPCHQAHLVDMTQRTQIVDHGAQIVPIRRDGGQRMRIAGRTGRGNERGDEAGLLLAREIARDRSSAQAAWSARSPSCPWRTRRSPRAPDTPSNCSPGRERRRRLRRACLRRGQRAPRDRAPVRAARSRPAPLRARRFAMSGRRSRAPWNAPGRNDRRAEDERCRRQKIIGPAESAVTKNNEKRCFPHPY